MGLDKTVGKIGDTTTSIMGIAVTGKLAHSTIKLVDKNTKAFSKFSKKKMSKSKKKKSKRKKRRR